MIVRTMRSSCNSGYGDDGPPPCEMFMCVYMLPTGINFRRKTKKKRRKRNRMG